MAYSVGQELRKDTVAENILRDGDSICNRIDGLSSRAHSVLSRLNGARPRSVPDRPPVPVSPSDSGPFSARMGRLNERQQSMLNELENAIEGLESFI